MKFLSLFAGIGGFDLGLERVGMECVGQVEINEFCNKVLEKHWPNVKRMKDIRDVKGTEFGTVELVCGGDPCPCRSHAKGNKNSNHPDLSGHYLALVGRLQPQWVVRENVPSSDDVWFVAGLEAIGYQSVIVSTNSAKVTAQNRERDFIVGSNPENIKIFESKIPQQKSHYRYYETKHEKTQVYPCLTTRSNRYDPMDGYIFDGQGLRVANSSERLKLSGFPDSWLDGFSNSAIARMTGNTVVPPIIEIIGKAIMQVEC